MKELLTMTIRKLKWGLYSIIDRNGREIAVANSFSEANRMIRKLMGQDKLLTNRTNIINYK